MKAESRATTWKDTPADPLPVNNRTVLHLLEALQYLASQSSGWGQAESRRLSFRALDIEQIGHVYEGLLDHTAKRATEPVLGLVGSQGQGTRNRHWPNWRTAANPKARRSLSAFLKDETGKTERH